MKKTLRVVAAVAAASLASVGFAACAPSAPAGDGEVTIFGGYGEADTAQFQKALDEFGAANNIKITFTSLAAFDKDIKVKIEAGQEPDIALWPQPGGLKDIAAAGSLLPLSDLIDVTKPQATLVPGWDTLAVVDGEIYGLPVSANMKSMVFYNPEAFTANGYTAPTNAAELAALEEQIIADGSGYPWCAGIESGGATGWAFTDWVEQYVLDLNGAEAYAKWVAGDLDFASPEVTAAVDEVSARLLADGHVNGGGAAMAADSFGNTAPLFELGGKAKGQCFMLRQGSFITGFFPDAIKAELEAQDYSNVGAFYLPAPEGAQAGVIGGGDIAAAFHKDADVVKVMEFLTSAEAAKYMVSNGVLSPHKTFDLNLYTNTLTRQIGESLANAEVFGFDGSDQMPAEVNAEFWAAGTDYVAGKASWADAAARIDGKY
jgi:alpha-glucoside transport system substrate-binding protein